MLILQAHHRRFTASLRVCLLLVLSVLCSAPVYADNGGAQTFLEGLRERRLYSLAEAFCKQQLNGQELNGQQRQQLTLELIRTYAGRAINARPGQRQPHWAAAHQIAATYLRAHKDAPGSPLITMQDALTLLARGELLRQEWEAGAGSQSSVETARQVVIEASTALEKLDTYLTREIPLRQRRRLKPNELSSDALFALQNNVRYHLARAFRNSARCYPPGAADRINSLQQSAEALKRLLPRLPQDDPLRWQSLIDQAVCQRLLGQLPEAKQTLVLLLQTAPPAQFRLQARAETVRQLLQQGKPDKAAIELSKGRTIAGKTSPQLDYAHLETYIDLWQAADKDQKQQEAIQWRNKAKLIVAEIERSHGPYWRRRADQLLVKAAGQGAGAGDLDILVRQAKAAYLASEFDKAINIYEAAGKQALKAEDKAEAFSMFYLAALIPHKRLQYAIAAGKMRALSLSLQEQPQAASTHLLAIFNVSRAVRKQPALVASYADMLEEHIATWPTAATAAQARMWLARLRQHQKSWAEAINLYLEIPPASDHYQAAVDAAAECAGSWLDDLRSRDGEYQQQALVMVNMFEDLVRDKSGKLPQEWNPATRRGALTAARIRMQHTLGGGAAATAILTAAINGKPEPDAAWLSQAQAIHVLALASQPGGQAEATQKIRQMAAASPTDLLQLVQGLTQSAQRAGDASQIAMSALQLEAISQLWPQRSKLTAAEQLSLETARAAALAMSGRHNPAQRKQAEAAYATLAAAHPRNAAIQQGYAALLLESSDSATLKMALKQWRRISIASRPRSDLWWRAKYSVALAQSRLGQKKEAASLIRYLKAVPPGLKGAPLERQFETLLQSTSQ